MDAPKGARSRGPLLIRRVSFIRRRAGMSREAFFAHWTGRHAEIVRRVPGLRGLRFHSVESCAPASAAWDGVGETWFDSVADALAAFEAEPLRALLIEDRPLFIGEAQTCFVEDVVGPPAQHRIPSP